MRFNQPISNPFDMDRSNYFAKKQTEGDMSDNKGNVIENKLINL